MDRQKILSDAIIKANKNGWSVYRTKFPHIGAPLLAQDMLEDMPYYKQLIFDHDFAKALWGFALDPLSDEAREINKRFSGGGAALKVKYYREGSGGDWEHHLREMVVAEDPIKYLGENL